MAERRDEAPFHIVWVFYEEIVQALVQKLLLWSVPGLDRLRLGHFDFDVDEDVAVEDLEYLLEGWNGNELI